MKKIREKLNTKGFTLVELIVVIVIVLILAAALVPNVMRYIDQARQSAFQSEAAAYLVEIQGYEAECYAKNDADLNDKDPDSGTSKKEYWDTIGCTLSGGMAKPTFTTVGSSGGYTDLPLKDKATKGITVYVKDGVVLAFGYTDGVNWVSWQQDKGWADVNDDTPWA